MNIALFSDSYIPTKSGVVTVILQLRKALESMGHHVVIVTVETTPGERKTREDDPCIFRARSIPLGLGTDQFIGFPQKRKIMRFLREHQIEIIHSHTEFYIAHAAKSLGRALHIPTIATTHTMWEDFYDYYVPMARLIPVKAIRKIVKRLYKKFYAFINVSSKAREYFKREHMLPHIPSAVIPNAVDTEAFNGNSDSTDALQAMRKNWGISETETVLLFVGRIGEEKRVLELLEIAIDIVNERDGVKALFVGSGPALEHMRKIVQKARLDHRIIFTGFVNWTDLHTYYGMSDIFFTASLSEMHSMTILEALISSLPIVARQDESYLDTVFPGENGYLAQSDQQMKQLTLSLIDDRDAREAFGKASADIAKRFSIETHTKRTVAFYQAVLDSWPHQLDEDELHRRIALV